MLAKIGEVRTQGAQRLLVLGLDQILHYVLPSRWEHSGTQAAPALAERRRIEMVQHLSLTARMEGNPSTVTPNAPGL